MENLIAAKEQLVAVKAKLHVNIVQCLKIWIEVQFSHEFSSKKPLFALLMSFINSLPNGSAVKSLLQNTIDAQTPQYSSLPLQPCYKPLIVIPFFISNKDVLSYPPIEIAKQITLLSQAMYFSIPYDEFLLCRFQKGNRETQAPALHQMVLQFNHLSNWIGSVIVSDKALVVKHMEQFITIGHHCLSFNDFHSVFAIVSGLSLAAIFRLTTAWSSISPACKEQFKTINAIASRDASFRKYKNTVKAASLPRIPYCGMALTDATFIEDGNPNRDSGNKHLVNFYKRKIMMQWVAQPLGEHQKVKYNFTPMPELQQKISSAQVLEENAMYAKSLEIQHRKPKALRDVKNE